MKRSRKIGILTLMGLGVLLVAGPPLGILEEADPPRLAPWLAPSSRLLICLKKSNLILLGMSLASGSGPCKSCLPTLPPWCSYCAPAHLSDSIETAVVISCACIPTLPPLVLLLLGKDPKSSYYHQPSGSNKPREQSHSGRLNSSYDKMIDKTAKPGRTDAIEMHPVSNDDRITRVVDIHTQWESV